MAETINIGEIASKISEDIFKHFLWETHPKRDDNFKCHNDDGHLSKGNSPKLTHPGDVVFHYDDPYLGKRVYLHTDLKSYAKATIKVTKLREAFKSLCMTVECARESDDWKKKYSIDDSECIEVRGLLFVHNHDNEYQGSFDKMLEGISLKNLPVARGSIVHFLGPLDIQRLYNIGNDIIRLTATKELPKGYTFYYPDLVMTRRMGDVWDQQATIEALTGPYLIIRHRKNKTVKSGYIIYYNRPGNSVDEFVYFLDTLSRYQMLETGKLIRVRVTGANVNEDLKSVFETAKKKYCKAWGFSAKREKVLSKIKIERITNMTSTYNPGEIGWRE